MDVDEVRSELEALGRKGFVERHGKWFLVLTAPDALDSFAAFVNTASRDAADILAGKDDLDEVDIFPLQPRRGSEVSIGREGADVVLPSGKISKLHAVFSMGGGLPSLSDSGSKNGTWLNGNKLPHGRAVPVDVGDTIQFASVSATLWSIDDLVAAVAGG
ncbi:MAG TPA: FHA domain-containing protein [Polyangia bacterium]|nr:FHA domain-containing protein [Polyangia bacterium]